MDTSTLGIYLNTKRIEEIIEKHLEWVEIEPGQIFCANGVMSENTPIGTSIIVGVDAIKCNQGSNILKLVVSEGIYEIEVRTVNANDSIDIHFNKTAPVPGTFGRIVDGELDILTDEEKEFKHAISDLLGDREDEYANAFNKDNVREVGGRGLILLEKLKAEIKSDFTLTKNNITPLQLASTFIELTEKYLEAAENESTLSEKHDTLLGEYHDTYDDGSKNTKRLAKNIESINQEIDANHKIGEFCKNAIEAAVMPVLNAEIER